MAEFVLPAGQHLDVGMLNSLAASVLGREQVNMLLHHCCSYIRGTVLEINLSPLILLAFLAGSLYVPCNTSYQGLQHLTVGHCHVWSALCGGFRA